jgi:3-hydroxybutyryl-CoA dehydrogenase
MDIQELRRVLIVGAGTVGQQVAVQCALHGYDVTIYDIDLDMLDAASAKINAHAAKMVTDGHLAQQESEATLSRILVTTSPEEAGAGADLLSESVPEDPDLKRKVLAQFNEICPPHTIFTTNTSTLIPSMFADATGRPAQFSALHFHPPVWTSNVVDIMPHQGTSDETVELLHAFARRIGQIPIFIKKESHNYVFNAMLNALNRAALSLAANEVASVEDIDRAWIGVTKMPIGPFGILDSVGLQTAGHIAEYWAKALKDPQLQVCADFLKAYVHRGWLGVKTGRGFYTYPHPLFQQAGFLTGGGSPPT